MVIEIVEIRVVIVVHWLDVARVYQRECDPDQSQRFRHQSAVLGIRAAVVRSIRKVLVCRRATGVVKGLFEVLREISRKSECCMLNFT